MAVTRLMAAGVLVLAVTACGTTAPQQSVRTVHVTTGSGLDGGPTTDEGAGAVTVDPVTGEVATELGAAGPEQTTGGPTGTSGTGGGGGGGGSTTTTTGGHPATPGRAGATSTRAGTTTTKKPGATAPTKKAAASPTKAGSTAAPLVVGVVTSGNAGAFASSVGINASFGDQRVQAQAVATYINQHGGVVGRKVALTYYDYDATSAASDGGNTNAQAACAKFTDDDHAFAAIGVAGFPEAYHACATQKGLLVLTDGDFAAPSFFSRFLNTYLISDTDLTRKYATEVDSAFARGWFTPGAKVGIIYQENPADTEAVKDGMMAALSRHGLKTGDTFAVNGNDSSSYAAGVQSAVLRFAANGVTHVLFGQTTAYLFQTSASSAGYSPKYFVDSRQSPALVMQTTSPQEQLKNTIGIGFQPLQDVDAAHDPGPVSARQTLCDTILADAGQTSSARLTTASAYYLCDQLFFLQDSLNGQPEVSLAAFRRGAAALAGTYASPLTFTTSFSTSKHDGANGYRDLVYDTGCSCFQYSSGIKPFSA